MVVAEELVELGQMDPLVSLAQVERVGQILFQGHQLPTPEEEVVVRPLRLMEMEPQVPEVAVVVELEEIVELQPVLRVLPIEVEEEEEQEVLIRLLRAVQAAPASLLFAI